MVFGLKLRSSSRSEFSPTNYCIYRARCHNFIMKTCKICFREKEDPKKHKCNTCRFLGKKFNRLKPKGGPHKPPRVPEKVPQEKVNNDLIVDEFFYYYKGGARITETAAKRLYKVIKVRYNL